MSKRLFIGFPVKIGSSLESAVKRTKIGADKREIDLEWVPSKNYHVTLNFLGNVSSEKIPQIIEAIERVASVLPPFETSIRGLGAFPDEHHMRVLWAGVRKSRALSFVQSELAEALAQIGFEPEGRDYIPHLTLARTRKSRSGKDLVSPYVRTSFEDVTVSRIALYESVLHGPRPVYEIVRSFDLHTDVSVDVSELERVESLEEEENEIESAFSLDQTVGVSG